MIRNAAARAVQAPQSQRRLPACFQPVSSTLTTEAVRIASRSSAYGWVSAALVRWQSASTAPTEIGQPKRSAQSAATSRRLIRFLTESAATAACNRQPNAPRGTSTGSSARVSRPQAGQASRCRRCSLTMTAIGGSSQTWWRRGAQHHSARPRRRRGRSPGSAPASARPARPLAPAATAAGAYLMARLAARATARRRLLRPRRRRRRILRGRQRRVLRVPPQPPLELTEPLPQPLILALQLIDATLEPRQPQQNLDARLPPAS